MRLAEIVQARSRLAEVVQTLPLGDFSDSVGISFTLREHDDLRQTVKRALGVQVLGVMMSSTLRRVGFDLPIKADVANIGERFVADAAWSYLLRRLPPLPSLSVLIPGCYMGGEDVQFWLRRGIRRLEGIDAYALTRHWSSIVPALSQKFGVSVAFRQGSIESIPFDDASFDVVTSNAVLEHVRNLKSMVKETARVLKQGGYALHAFGPLYYSFGADHCISAYGLEAGYDHLLLQETDYRERIYDRDYFKRATGNADLAFWAVNEQFSFATAAQYIDYFKRHFEIGYVAVTLSAEGLEYRSRFPDRWRGLVSAGVSEADLLTKGLAVVVRKPMQGASG